MTGKFDWINAVHADDRIPLGEKAVLVYAAIFDVLGGTDTFCIRQDTLADHCGTSRKTVGCAIRRARSLGYLAVAQQHRPGPGAHRGDELRLTLPESWEDTSHDSPEWREDTSHDYAESWEDTSPNDGKIVPKSWEDTSRAYKEYGSFNGSRGGSGAPPESREDTSHQFEAEINRPPMCPKHPDGPYHDENCRRRKLWREWLEAQPQRAEEARQREAKRRKATIDACNRCDDNGMIDLGNSMRRCKHDAEKVT
jgi:Helix-turn-helix domain